MRGTMSQLESTTKKLHDSAKDNLDTEFLSLREEKGLKGENSHLQRVKYLGILKGEREQNSRPMQVFNLTLEGDTFDQRAAVA